MIIYWSKIGDFHYRNQQGIQDTVFSYENGIGCTISLADGVSTCERGEEGANIACHDIGQYFSQYGSKLINYSPEDIRGKTLNRILNTLEKRAMSVGDDIDKFSSTLTSVFFDKEKKSLLCFNLGDSLIGGVKNENFEIILQPQIISDGCYATTTENVESVIEVKIVSATDYSSVFICSDGMWKQMFNRGKLRYEYNNMILKGDYIEIIENIKKSPCHDDRSIVAMKLEFQNERVA